MTQGLKKAKELLQNNNYTCVLIKQEITYTSTERGVKPLLQWLENQTDLAGCSAADKVVGKAAAFLYVLLKIKELYACVLSKPAGDVLQKHGITVYCDVTVDAIRNRTNTGYCPMEQATVNTDDPNIALDKIKKTLKKLTE